MATRPPPAFDVSVFVNCPFDDQYKPLLDAALFAIHDCGFVARTALEVTGSGVTRLEKIARIVDESRFSIHDVSRVEISASSPLPRFNMPFECGLAFGALHYKPQKKNRARDILLLAAERFQDKRTLSDLAGQDAAYHEGQPQLLIKAVRRFLASKAHGILADELTVRGGQAIVNRFVRFNADLPVMAAHVNITMVEIGSLEYLPEWLNLATRWQVANLK